MIGFLGKWAREHGKQGMLTVDFPVTREYMASRLADSGLSGLSYSRPTKAAQRQPKMSAMALMTAACKQLPSDSPHIKAARGQQARMQQLQAQLDYSNPEKSSSNSASATRHTKAFSPDSLTQTTGTPGWNNELFSMPASVLLHAWHQHWRRVRAAS